MKSFLNKLTALAGLAAICFAAGCEPEIEAPAISKGDLNLDKYLAVGNSLTAGFMDGGLYREGQESSYPAILAGQFQQVGGGEFKQPLFTEEQRNGSGYLSLTGFSATGAPVVAPVITNLGLRSFNPILYTKYTDEVNNLGVPGISVLASAVPQYSAGNPYFERLLPPAGVGTTSYLQFIGGRNHTFFSCWLGSNDVLTYATNGGEANPNNPFSGLTEETTFRAIYTGIITTLTANGAKGIVATIPDVTGIPFFTTVSVAAVRAAAKQVNAQLDVYIRTGPNPTDVRLAEAEDLILLTTQANIGRLDQVGGQPIPHGFHPANPLTDTEVLDKDEVTAVKDRTVALNNAIVTIANGQGLAVFDVYAYFNQIKGGITLNGIAHSPAYITGNLFSLDGVHLTPRGYAIVANEMIKVINAKYNARIPTADITQYRAVRLP